MSADILASIELQLAQLSIDDRKALARRLNAQPKHRPKSDLLADRLLAFLRDLRQHTDCLPTNRDIESQAALEGEDISYLLKILRRRGAVVVEYPAYGSSDRTFELPW